MTFWNKFDPADLIIVGVLVIVETALIVSLDLELQKAVIHMGLGGVLGYATRAAREALKR